MATEESQRKEVGREGDGFTNKDSREKKGEGLVIESVDCGWPGADKGTHFQPQ